jgi:Fe-S-cluster formation regulator IscX/YfhJ
MIDQSMIDMIDQRMVVRLSEISERRRIDRLQNGQVELYWDQCVLRMRTTDLAVLNSVLQSWMEEPDRNWGQTYSLWLGDYVMFLQWSDLHSFCAMVHEASEQLPRRSVRWIDLNVLIAPYNVWEHSNRSGCFSLN